MNKPQQKYHDEMPQKNRELEIGHWTTKKF